MKIKEYTFEATEILDRVCETYGFHQKAQLAEYFKISPSSLSNRYMRGTISYDFAAICALETGASLKWLLLGEGEKFSIDQSKSEGKTFDLFTLSENRLSEKSQLRIGDGFFAKQPNNGFAVRFSGGLYFIDKDAKISDGSWLISIDDSISIRKLAKLPGNKIHVSGGAVDFECTLEDLEVMGRVVGIYSEIDQ